MEHIYVITGNEYGADLHSKKNFKVPEQALEAIEYFDEHKEDDFYCMLVKVDSNGNETIAMEQTNDE